MVGCRNGVLAEVLMALALAAALPGVSVRGQTLADAGAIVYALRCSGCHGVDLNNTSGGQVFDLRKLRPDEHDRFVNSVISGKDMMPSWYGILTAAEIDAIWAYIRATVDR
jgi:mono/diheme cytochrome c family protein